MQKNRTLKCNYDRENNDYANALQPRRFKWCDFSTNFICFQPMTPPDKMFKNKHVEFVLVCIGSIEEVDQVLCAEKTKPFLKVIVTL